MRVQLTRPGGPLSVAAGMVVGLPLCNLVWDMDLGFSPGTALLLGSATVLGSVALVLLPILATTREAPETPALEALFDSPSLRFCARCLLLLVLWLLVVFSGAFVQWVVGEWAGTAPYADGLRRELGSRGASTAATVYWMLWTLLGVRASALQQSRSAAFFVLLSLVVLIGGSVPHFQRLPVFHQGAYWFGWMAQNANATVGLWYYLVGVAFVVPLLLRPAESPRWRLAAVLGCGALLMFLVGAFTVSGWLNAMRLKGFGFTGGPLPHIQTVLEVLRGSDRHVFKMLLYALTAIVPIRLATTAIARLVVPRNANGLPVALLLSAAALAPGPWWSWDVNQWGFSSCRVAWAAWHYAAEGMCALAGLVAAKRLVQVPPRSEWIAVTVGLAPTFLLYPALEFGGFVLESHRGLSFEPLIRAFLPYFLTAAMALALGAVGSKAPAR